MQSFSRKSALIHFTPILRVLQSSKRVRKSPRSKKIDLPLINESNAYLDFFILKIPLRCQPKEYDTVMGKDLNESFIGDNR